MKKFKQFEFIRLSNTHIIIFFNLCSKIEIKIVHSPIVTLTPIFLSIAQCTYITKRIPLGVYCSGLQYNGRGGGVQQRTGMYLIYIVSIGYWLVLFVLQQLVYGLYYLYHSKHWFVIFVPQLVLICNIFSIVSIDFYFLYHCFIDLYYFYNRQY